MCIRDRLTDALSEVPGVLKIYPSDANFLLVEFENAAEVMAYLLGERIIVRDRSKVTLCAGCLRITVGTDAENEVLLNALKKFQQNSVIA